MITRRSGRAPTGAVSAAAKSPVPEPPGKGSKEGGLARIQRTRRLRVSGPAGEDLFLIKNAKGGEWSGFCAEMGRDLAKQLEVEPEFFASGEANAAADLQANKFDIFIGLAPTVRRAVSVDFSSPLFHDTFVILARADFKPSSWMALNVPETRMALDNDSPAEAIARRFAANATITGFKSRDECLGALKSARSDCYVTTLFPALLALKGDAQLGRLVVPTPAVQSPLSAALQYDDDHRLHEIVDAWGADVGSSGQMREWILAALEAAGIAASTLPPELSF